MTPEGSTLVTPQFAGIGTEDGKIDLQSIKCNEEAEDLVALSTLDEVGGVLKTYNWTSLKGVGLCWVDSKTMKLPTEPVEFKPGEAFWVESDDGENVITFPGVDIK